MIRLFAAVFMLVFCSGIALASQQFRGPTAAVLSSTRTLPSAGGGGGGGDVTIDTVTTSATGDTSLTFYHTFGADANAACVFVMQADGGRVTSVTVDSAAATVAAQSIYDQSFVGGTVFCKAYSGGAGVREIVVTQPAAQKLAVAVISLKNVNTSSIVRSTGSLSDISTSATSLSTAAATTVSGNLLLTYGGTYSNKVLSCGAGETQRSLINQSTLSALYCSEPAAGASVTVSMSWTGGERAEFGFIEVSKTP